MYLRTGAGSEGMAQALHIGDWEVLPAARLLRGGNRELRLSPRAMDVLVHLSSRPGDVVSVDELLNLFWPHTVRSPNAVAKVITELRKALSLTPHSPVLETVPKRGYRLWPGGAPEGVITAPARAADNATVDVKIIGMGKRTAVLIPPVAGSGVTADLVAHAQRELVGQAGQRSDIALRSWRAPAVLDEAGMRAAADADYAVTLRIDSARDAIAVTLIVIPAEPEVPSYRERFDAAAGASTAAIEQAVTTAFEVLTVLLDDAELARMREWRTRNVTAYVALREALPLIRNWTVRTMQQAETLLRRAIDADPKFALAYQWLSGVHHSYSLLGGDPARKEALRLSQQQLLRQAQSARIDPDVIRDLDRHLSLISVATPTDSETYWHKELENNPTSVHALRRYGELLLGARLIDESERYLRRAMELSPANDRDWLALDEVGLAQARGQFELSVQLIKRNLERIPDHTWHLYAIVSALAKLGRYQEAQRYLDRLEAISPGWAFLARQHLLTLRGDLRPGSNLIGEFFAHKRANNANRGITSFMMGDVDAGLHFWREIEPDRLPSLWQYLPSYEQCWPPHVMADPRYQALLDELGFGRRWQAWMRERAIELTPVTGIEVTTPAA